MGAVALVGFALVAGVTFFGLAASLVELATGRRLSFADPVPGHAEFWRQIAMTAAAGPFMLFNDTLDAWRSGAIGPISVAASFVIASAWSLAAGVLLVELGIALAAALP